MVGTPTAGMGGTPETGSTIARRAALPKAGGATSRRTHLMPTPSATRVNMAGASRVSAPVDPLRTVLAAVGAATSHRTDRLGAGRTAPATVRRASGTPTGGASLTAMEPVDPASAVPGRVTNPAVREATSGTAGSMASRRVVRTLRVARA
ncbi:hypothetical protein JMUB6875_65260 [Nocardia sp. JMUB6875]